MAVTGMSPTAYELSEEEQAIVEVVREFVDRQVKPVVRELEHSNTYPEELIEQIEAAGDIRAWPFPLLTAKCTSRRRATRWSPRNSPAAG